MMNAPPSQPLGGAFIVRSASTLGEPPLNEPTPTDPTDPLANAIADLAKAISASGAETAPFDAPLSLAVVAEELDELCCGRGVGQAGADPVDGRHNTTRHGHASAITLRGKVLPGFEPCRGVWRTNFPICYGPFYLRRKSSSAFRVVYRHPSRGGV
jgi:hypothetical protein